MRVSLGFAHSIHLGRGLLARRRQRLLHLPRPVPAQPAGHRLRAASWLYLALSRGPMLSAAVQIDDDRLGPDRALHPRPLDPDRACSAAWSRSRCCSWRCPAGWSRFIVDEVIFSPDGGNNRIAICQYGSAEVLRHPLFGIGLQGLGAAVLAERHRRQLLARDRHALRPAGARPPGARHRRSTPRGSSAPSGCRRRPTRYRTGYLVALVGLVTRLGTVHVWEAPQVLVHDLYRRRVWFYTSAARAAAAEDPGPLAGSAQAALRRPGRLARPARSRPGDDPGAARTPRPGPPPAARRAAAAGP